jgi:predicted RNase H-like nuclease (RuvC/YqgF family)
MAKYIIIGLIALIIIGAGIGACLTRNGDETPDATSTSQPLTVNQKLELLTDRIDDLIARMQTYEHKISQLQKSLDEAYARINQLKSELQQ